VAAGSAVMNLAEKLYSELLAKGIDVIMDDRDERPGVKFKDSELVGFPVRIGIGEKSLAKGEVELKPRGGTLEAVKAEEVIARVMQFLEKAAN
jgi:prolyl-tRNA synthetase